MSTILSLSPINIDFNDWIEKLSDMTHVWIKKWIIVEGNKIFFYDSRPLNDMEISRPKEVYVLDNLLIKVFKEYRNLKLSIKKSNVLLLNNSGTSITISLKSEKDLYKLMEILNKIKAYGGGQLLPAKNYKTEKNKENVNPKLVLRKPKKNLQFSSGKKESEDSSKKPRNMFNTFKNGFLNNNKKAQGDQTDPEITVKNCYPKHAKTRSCGEINLPTTKMSNSYHLPTEDNPKAEKKASNQLMDHSSKPNVIIGNKKQARSRNPKNEETQNYPSAKDACVGKTYQNEENSSLQKMINNMLQSTKKLNKKMSDSFLNNMNYMDESINYDGIENHDKSDVSFNNFRLDSRKKQINKIIKLSLPNTERSSHTVYLKPNKLNFESINDDQPKDSASKIFNFNLSQDEMSFDEKECKKTSILVPMSSIKQKDYTKECKLDILVNKLENVDEYFFDSTIFKRIYKSLDFNKSDIGLIYNSVKKTFIKSQLLTEMIAILSKNFMKQSILKSLEIVLREKEMNKNYFILPNHQHSLEFCIVDIFNTFLGNNREADEFYTKILPNYLVDYFKINFILNIKSQISIPNLFVIMQSHNRIYFNDNMDINFMNPSPFVIQDIKYISPYNVNKWYYLAIKNEPKTSLFENNNGTTNIKRMKYMNFEMKDNFENTMEMLKKSERDAENLRISLVKNIYFHIFHKRNELALKLCDFYVQKFTESIFLNPIIYLILSEIYNETYGLEYSRLFYNKAINILQWQFPDQTNPLLIDLNYTFSLILLKNSVNDESEFNSSVYFKEIEELLEKSKELSEKLFDCENEKKCKIVLQSCLIKISQNENNNNSQEYSLNFSQIVNEILSCLDFLRKIELYKEEAIYLNLFIDVFNSIPVEDETKIKFIQRLHEVKKFIKNK